MMRMRRGVGAGGGEGAAGDEYGEVTVSEGGGTCEKVKTECVSAHGGRGGRV